MKKIIEFLSENIIFIFSILMIFIIIYLLYRTSKMEKFAITNAAVTTTAADNINDLIKKAVNSQYNIDISAMRNLGSIADMILTENDILNIPAFNVKMNAIHLTNNNPVDTNIFTRYMIIPWAGDVNNIPRGWVLCDGLVYNIDNINDYLNDSIYDSIYNNKVILNKYTINSNEYIASKSMYVVTPDLRGKFIFGAGTINITNDNKNMYVSKDGKSVSVVGDIITLTPGNTGGEHYHVLTNIEIPAHRHQISLNNIYGADTSDKTNTIVTTITYDDTSQTTGPMITRSAIRYGIPGSPNVNFNKIEYTDYGGLGNMNKVPASLPSEPPKQATFNPVPVNNMPPYYVLTYIMKL